MLRILVVDDESAVLTFCRQALETAGSEVHTAPDVAGALETLAGRRIDLVITDVRMPAADGYTLLETIRQEYPRTRVVVMTGYGSIREAVRALQMGACHYVTKPFTAQDLRRIVDAAMRRSAPPAARPPNPQAQDSPPENNGIIGTSPSMQRVFALIARFANDDSPVLIQGETGTGKELVARAIQSAGAAHALPFVVVDCGALCPTLVESELFGHTRGAFTGAERDRKGLLAVGMNGTVFLDEVQELPLEMQAKLLRVLQEREIRPLGSNEPVSLRVRIIAATNRDLDEAMERGTFRRDLYYRLSVLRINMPPLRERREDIPLLARHFLCGHCKRTDRPREISPEAMLRLLTYDWPGNVRELENCVRRALVLSSGPQIQPSDLWFSLQDSVEPTTGLHEKNPTLRELEKEAILGALQSANGDRAHAAKLLGIGKTTIYRKLKEYDVGPERTDLG
jgi:two-component system response regulator HydG